MVILRRQKDRIGDVRYPFREWLFITNGVFAKDSLIWFWWLCPQRRYINHKVLLSECPLRVDFDLDDIVIVLIEVSRLSSLHNILYTLANFHFKYVTPQFRRVQSKNDNK